MSAFILKTKLELPYSSKTLMRSRLIRIISQNIDKKLILIYADAGYGKTTLISHIISELNINFIYFDPEPCDQDLATFINYLVTAIREQYSAFDLDQSKIITNASNPDILIGLFINECKNVIKNKLYLIIDNFHNIEQNASTVKAINYLIQHLPVNLRCIIASRSKPNIDLM